MAREIVLDTETTGLDPLQGHRVIEIACVELEDFLPTGRHFHCYVDPERDVDPDAERVHGLSRAFLTGKPRFADAEVAEALVAFLGEAIIVAHNAGFDRGFLNHELERAGRAPLIAARWVDTLALAQKRFPGMYNSLDALCKRYRISLAERDRHGALVDAKLLAGVYLELRGGRERRLELVATADPAAADASGARVWPPRPRPLVPRLTGAERAAHAAFIAAGVKDALWDRFDLDSAASPRSGAADGLALGLGLAGQIDGGEVDRLEHEGREAALG
ncbi:MAG: DNA polymerase III subunit epsilon [Caulobacteraceae bacterium]